MQTEKNWLIGLLIVIAILGCALGACLVGAAGGALIYSAVDRTVAKEPETEPPPGWEHPGPGMPGWDDVWPPSPEDIPALPERRPVALVLAVDPDGPADSAGIQAGDMILAVDDQEISRARNLASILQDYRPNDRVEITLWRAGKEQTVRVQLGEKLSESGKAVPFLGLTYRHMQAMPIPTD